MKKISFPIIESYILIPKEGNKGKIGICTNTTTPGEVLNEIEKNSRKNICVSGSLIVNRDGAERMIINSLAHPTLQYLILFSEEALSFSPSTNLLLAIQYGFDSSNNSHNIINGKSKAANYPNLSKKIFDAFRKEIIVLPIFMYKNDYSCSIIDNYLDFIKDEISGEMFLFLKKANNGKKIYYNTLNKLIEIIQKDSTNKAKLFSFDSSEFERLQPPIEELKSKDIKPKVFFAVSNEKGEIRLDIKVGNKTYFIKSNDERLLEYSLMKFLKEEKNLFSPMEQMLLGAEISRVNTEIKNNIQFPSFISFEKIKGIKEIKLESNFSLIPDKKYYYRVDKKKNSVSVVCFSYEECKELFDARSASLFGVIKFLSNKNLFEDYEMDFLHRMDVGGQAARAAIALKLNRSFIQDFPYLFEVNKDNLPFLIADSDTFLCTHKSVVTQIYTAGLTEEHGDKHKGLARSASVLAIFRDYDQVFKKMPEIYKQGGQETKEMRDLYKKQLLMFETDGDYSYGQRTRSYFDFDQLNKAIELLKKDPKKAVIVQRFDPKNDMGSYIDKETGKIKYTHDPCLTHDIFFIRNGKLHSFHIARAHNVVNAYPENIFGLHDAYLSTIKKSLKADSGDMYVLSNRANILLLTEEQKTKTIISEPSKPADEINSLSGPYLISKNTQPIKSAGSIAYIQESLKENNLRPKNSILNNLENFGGVNIIQRAIDYLKKKGVMHNNPILSEYQPGKMDAQGDYLAFFQANVMGGKVNATAVFINHSIGNVGRDKKLINYITTQYSSELKYSLGNLLIFYINHTK